MFTNLWVLFAGRRGVYAIRSIIVLIFLVSVFTYIRANSSGRTGSTNTGCTCHGSSNSATSVSVSSQSGSFSVLANSTSTFTVTVSSSSRNYYGVNIGVKTTSNGETNAGTLSASNSDLRVSNGELTHQSPKNGSGSATFTFTWTAPATAGTYYLKAVGNAVDNNNGSSGDQWNTMSVQTITVTTPTEIALTSPNGGESWCAGTSRNITWTSSNVNNVNIDLSTNGGSSFSSTLATNVSASSGSWSWSIPSGQQIGNNYKIRISDASNASLNSVSNGSFSIAPVTAISSHPQSTTSCSGLQVLFSVTASGSGLSYQWKKDGVDIQGGSSATLTLNNIQPAQAGSYTCTVSGSCGSPLSSNAAILTVEAAPKITVQPTEQSACTGSPVTFSLTATGVDLTYQWRKNGTAVPGANTASYTINSVSESDGGNYDCVVSGKCSPEAISSPVLLRVSLSPTITVQPKTITPCEGSKSFIFVGSAGANLSYVWMKNGIDIPNSNNDTLFFSKVSNSDAGFYSVKITGTCTPPVTSGAASLTPQPLALITQQPEAQTIAEGNSASFSVKADGQGISFQWFKNAEKLTGKTSSILNLANVKSGDAGKYFCEITNGCGKKYSDSVSLTVIPASKGPVLTLSRSSQNFGNVKIGAKKSVTIPSAITNNGNEKLTITNIEISGVDAASFSIENLTLPANLDGGKTLDFSLAFNPLSVGSKTAEVIFTSNSSVNPKLSLSGNGASISLSTNKQELSFTVTNAGDSVDTQLSFTNNSSIDLTAVPKITGKDAAYFSILEGLKSINAPKGETKSLTVRFKPDTWHSRSAELVLAFEETGDELKIPLSGNVTTDVSVDIRNNVRVYPNPSGEMLTIDLRNLNRSIGSIKIHDIEGREVGDLNNQKEDDVINYGSSLPSGMYNLILTTGEGLLKLPFIVK